MRILTVAEIQENLNLAWRAGRRVDISRAAVDTQVEAMVEGVEAAVGALAPFGPPADSVDGALDELIERTTPLYTLVELVGLLNAAHRRAGALLEPTAETLTEMANVLALDIPAEFLSDDQVALFGQPTDADAEPGAVARGLLRLDQQQPLDDLAALMANWTYQRLWAIHARVLAGIAAAGPADADDDAAGQLRSALETASRSVRDSLAEIGAAIAAGQLLSPALAIRLRLAIHAAEQAVLGSLDQLAAAASAATNRAATAPVNDPVVRDAAIAYDHARLLLAYAAGGWAVYRGTAVDQDLLAAFATAAGLPRGSATLDLARSTVAAASGAATGTEVEIAGVVRDLSVVAGGPAPRSVMMVGAATGTQLRVFVPFVAVDSFGVVPGTWAQLRGEIFADGKDDLDGPLLQVRRIRREEAAAASFSDWLIWTGRHEFELRPGGLDIAAGRSAGSIAPLVELGFRPLEVRP